MEPKRHVSRPTLMFPKNQVGIRFNLEPQPGACYLRNLSPQSEPGKRHHVKMRNPARVRPMLRRFQNLGPKPRLRLVHRAIGRRRQQRRIEDVGAFRPRLELVSQRDLIDCLVEPRDIHTAEAVGPRLRRQDIVS